MNKDRVLWQKILHALMMGSQKLEALAKPNKTNFCKVKDEVKGEATFPIIMVSVYLSCIKNSKQFAFV